MTSSLLKSLLLICLALYSKVNCNKIESVNSTNNSSPACPCLNNGVCFSNDTCKCMSGFYGKICEFGICDSSSLLSKQCKNGACLINAVSKETFCYCKPTHTGLLCEKLKCLDYCYNNGYCNDGLGNQYDFDDFLTNNYTNKLSCKCTNDRFSGERCELDKCYDKAEKCKSNCYLDSVTCECKCGTDCDNLYCGGFGTCDQQNDKLVCRCKIPYSGPTCAINECNGYCFNNGTCQISQDKYFCNCAERFNGSRCENEMFLKSKEKSSFRIVIYAFVVTITICLITIGVYYSLQKGYLKYFERFNPFSSRQNISNLGRSGFSFNKLEDEQIIVQNDHTVNA